MNPYSKENSPLIHPTEVLLAVGKGMEIMAHGIRRAPGNAILAGLRIISAFEELMREFYEARKN
ncbi:MAG: hypothetical protein Q9203_005657, partial [Teloschistes exilis]